MKIAITGATGFIGHKLMQKHCDAGDEVTILSRRNIDKSSLPLGVRVIKGDLLSESQQLSIFLEGVDVLYHCAAEIKNETRMHEVNVVGTKNLINANSNPDLKWVQLSSVGVYGPKHEGYITEQCDYNPNNTYEKTKLSSDELVIEAGMKRKLKYVILRPSNVFGTEMRNKSLFKLIRAVNNNTYFFIGPKGASANYIDVENVVNALVLCAKSAQSDYKIYNISDWTTMENFIKVIAKSLNKSRSFIRVPLFLMNIIVKSGKFIPGFPFTQGKLNALTNRSVYLTNLIEKELNYFTVVPVEKGIERLVLSKKWIDL